MENDLSIIHFNENDLQKSIKVELTKDDIIAFKVSEQEDVLEGKRNDLQKKLEAQRRNIADTQKKLDKAVTAAANDKYGDAVKGIQDAYKTFGLDREIKIHASLVNKSADSDNGSKSNISVTLNIGKDGGSYYGHSEDLKEIPLTAEVKSLVKDANDQEQEVSNTINLIADIRTILQNMSRLERKTKAEFVKKVLSQNVELRKYLNGGSK